MEEKENRRRKQECKGGSGELCRKEKKGMNVFSCFQCFWKTEEDKDEPYELLSVSSPVQVQLIDRMNQDIVDSSFTSSQDKDATNNTSECYIFCSDDSFQQPTSCVTADRQAQSILGQRSKSNTISSAPFEFFPGKPSVSRIIANSQNELQRTQRDIATLLKRSGKFGIEADLTFLKVSNDFNPVLNRIIEQSQLNNRNQQHNVQSSLEAQKMLETVHYYLIHSGGRSVTLAKLGGTLKVCLQKYGKQDNVIFCLNINEFDWLISILTLLLSGFHNQGDRRGFEETDQKVVACSDPKQRGISMEADFAKQLSSSIKFKSQLVQVQRFHLTNGVFQNTYSMKQRKSTCVVPYDVSYSAHMLRPLDMGQVIYIRPISILHGCTRVLLKDHHHNRGNETFMQLSRRNFSTSYDSGNNCVVIKSSPERQVSVDEKKNPEREFGVGKEDTMIQVDETDYNKKDHRIWIATNEDAFGVLNDRFTSLIMDRYPTFDRTWMFPVDTQRHLNVLKVTPFERLNTLWIEQSTVVFFRSIQGFPFAPVMNLQGRKHINDVMKSIANSLDGHFIDIATEDSCEREIYKKYQNQLLKPKSYARGDWPDNRTILVPKDFNKNKQTVVKVNYDEHLEIRCQTKGGALKQALVEVLKMEQLIREALGDMNLSFCHHEEYGYLNSNLAHLGIGMIIKIQMNIPLLQQHFLFDEILKYYALKRSYYGRKKGRNFNILELESTMQFGFSEVENVHNVYDAAAMMIKIERRLEHRKDIASLLPDVLKQKYIRMCGINTAKTKTEFQVENLSETSKTNNIYCGSEPVVCQIAEYKIRENSSIMKRENQKSAITCKDWIWEDENGPSEPCKPTQTLQGIHANMSSLSRPLATSERRLRFGDGRHYPLHPVRYLTRGLEPNNLTPFHDIERNGLLQTEQRGSNSGRHRPLEARMGQYRRQSEAGHPLAAFQKRNRRNTESFHSGNNKGKHRDGKMGGD